MNKKTDTNASASKWIGLALVVILGVMAYGVLTMPDNRTGAERVGDAISELPDVDDAASQLGDRTPGERMGNAIENAGEDIRDAANNN